MLTHTFEMALTRADFLRLLPEAVQGSFSVHADEVSGTSAGVAWHIRLAELEPRRIALLSLPRLTVGITLKADTSSAAEEWLRRFLLGYQRAGG